jgi:hypothetical protein
VSANIYKSLLKADAVKIRSVLVVGVHAKLYNATHKRMGVSTKELVLVNHIGTRTRHKPEGFFSLCDPIH